MKTCTYVLQKDENGLHARPAGELVTIARQYISETHLYCKGRVVDAKKLFAVMSLHAKKDDELKVSVSGIDEDLALSAINAFFLEYF